MLLTTDLADAPGDPVPPLIGGHRPDIFARCSAACLHCLIAEAKTDGDIDKPHTRRQVSAFLNHLEALAPSIGTFILAVNGNVAGIARNLLHFDCRGRTSSQLRVELFDGLDFWTLGQQGAPLWRLS